MKTIRILGMIMLVGLINTATAQNLYRHKSGSTYGFYDANNSLKIAYQYDDALNFNENLAAVKKAGKWGYISPSNITVIPFEYDDAWYFTQGLAAVKKGGKWGFIDANNAVIIPFNYSDAADFSDGLAWVEKNAQIGFISKTNEIVIPFQYNAANSFESGLAAVQKNGKWGYINKSNSVVIPMRYENATYITDGFAPVKFGSYWGYFDTYGNQVTDFSFSTHTDESFLTSIFGKNYAAYSYKQLENLKKGDLVYGMYLDHLKKALQIIRKNQTYFSYDEWKLLAKYYDKVGDDENYKIAKKNSKKPGGSVGKFNRPRIFIGTAPVKLAMTNKYHHFPLYFELSAREIALAMRYNTITNYEDKWKFGGWRDAADQNYPYSGTEISGFIFFKGKKEFRPGMEFRYGSYEFSPFNVTLTDKNTGFGSSKMIAPVIKTYDLTFIANFRKSWKLFYGEIGYSMGLGYKTWDYGYNQDQFSNSLKRFEDKWLPLQMPFRVHVRAGIRL